MNWPIIIIIATQLLFTTSDLLARFFMPKHGFALETFFSVWFLVYFLIRTIAMFGQLYVFTTIELGKTMALFGAASIILANLLGFLVLKEVLSPGAYIGISLAVVAFLFLALL
jgi:multidrug transporter EmrE-like cation transporter